jgi:DNA (cytosine-5)-methyltransferase 1
VKILDIADLLAGAGGTTSGAVEAAELLRCVPRVTAVNHWKRATNTIEFNHPDARVRRLDVQETNPLSLYRHRGLNILLASPECRMDSDARNSLAPIDEKSRATAYCVPRWLDALEPDMCLVENVARFMKRGPKRDGSAFRAWLEMCRTAGSGYRFDYRVLCAADYGDPTTRERLFVQFQRGRRKIVWPNPTHAEGGAGGLLPWVPARAIIDWSIPGQSIYAREKPLAENTLRRIFDGLERFGGPGLLPQHQGGVLRPVYLPVPTVATDGAIALIEPFLVTYYGTGGPRSVRKPLDTVTTRDRFGLVQAKVMADGGRQYVDITYRMLRPKELALAQGFHPSYRFDGNETEQKTLIGNAVPRRMARALVLAAWSQNPDVSALMREAA